MALLLGIDLGTSYFKVGLFDETGALKGLGRIAVEPATPAPGRFELSVDAFWDRLRRGLAEALRQAGGSTGEIAGVSYSSQANTFVLLDDHDAPLTPLVLWTDQRGGAVDPDMARFAETETFGRTVGLVGISGGFAVGKLRWFAANQPDVWRRTRRIMTISDYFTFALTGERVGDASTAAFLGLYDLTERRWWSDALRTFQVDADTLSTPLPPGTPCGRTDARATARLGLPAGIPFAVGGLDHHVAALGSGLGRFADMSISTGTVLAAMALVDRVVPSRGCYHGPHFGGSGFFRLAFDPLGAGQLEDYQRRFAPGHSIEQLIALAARVPAGSKPAAQLGGVRTDHDHGVSMRHLLESIAATHRVLGARVAGANQVNRIVATGGGARSGVWLQIKADILGVPIVTPTCPELACLGAAALAGVAAGKFKDIAEASDGMVRESACYRPAGAASN